MPRRGRLVVFASGEENVHAVGSVTSGARATLNLWLTFDEGLEVKL
jgi:predicted 2-oxoglutarate/Fe(II)-dependent dioxygenase YbiX